jgi:hypothetical protein
MVEKVPYLLNTQPFLVILLKTWRDEKFGILDYLIVCTNTCLIIDILCVVISLFKEMLLLLVTHTDIKQARALFQ